MRIADDLLASAEHDAPGSITWGRGYGRALQPVADAGMFNGRIGEAFFFAALAAATGADRYADGALRASATLRATIGSEGGRRRLMDEVAIGLVGVGSMMYAFVHLADWLADRRLLDSAVALAESVTPSLLAGEPRPDFFWGAAGTVHGLLALHEAGVPDFIATATEAGDFLERAVVIDDETGLRGWSTMGPGPWAGFAHGSAGVASAMTRLYRHVPDARYRDVALEALAFERAVREASTGDWPDSRTKATGISGWCHGAGGVALSRLCAIEDIGNTEALDAELVGDLDAALTHTIEDGLGRVDHTCCGSFGRVDVLLEASRVLENPSLAATAAARAAHTLMRIDRRGFELGTGDRNGRHLGAGMWQGLAGIGYVLLRASDPVRWPSALRLG